MILECHSLAPPKLERFLERHKAALTLTNIIALDQILKEILRKANEFVPAEAGSILLDDPMQKLANRESNDLVFIATFGRGSERLVGSKISAKEGIAGRVYQTGMPYLSQHVDKDEFFLERIDEEFGFETHSIVGVPIYIGKNVCGVLELINRSEGRHFTTRDKTLLEIFAGYTSFTFQNSLDAKRAHELAKRDDLTGLFNDRWLHMALGECLRTADEKGEEFVVIFMDLDNFKTINDHHGHLAGSQVLREVGLLLTRTVSIKGATISRYGGDEFVMILPGTSLEEAIQIAKSVETGIKSQVFLDREYGFGMPAINLQGILSASIGVAQFVPSPTNAPLDVLKNDLLRRADTAMYEAKARGKGTIVVSHEGYNDEVKV